MKSPSERTPSTSRIPSSPGESRIPRPSFSSRKSSIPGAVESSIPKPVLDPAWSGGGSSLPTARVNGGAENSIEPDTSSDKVLVTVRLRPLRLDSPVYKCIMTLYHCYNKSSRLANSTYLCGSRSRVPGQKSEIAPRQISPTASEGKEVTCHCCRLLRAGGFGMLQ